MVQCLNDYQRPEKQSASDWVDMCEATPTRILTLAIRKRRELVEQKYPDMHRELLNKTLIHQLCKQLGERRSKKLERRSSSKRRNQSIEDEYQSKRAYYEDEDRLILDDSDQQGDFLTNRPTFVEEDACSSTMVQIESEHLDYTQMERYLDANQSLDGYTAQWSNDSECPELKTEFNHTFQTSLNTLQPTSSNSDSVDEIDPEDPLKMAALFRDLYRVVDPQQG